MSKESELLGRAWGVIANASGGNWANESEMWQDAAAAWRDDYHEWLDAYRKERYPNLTPEWWEKPEPAGEGT